MELKPGYKMTEVGVIPEDWRIVHLGDFLCFSNGINGNNFVYGDGTHLISVLEAITYTHLSDKNIKQKINLPDKVVSQFLVTNGDVLFNRTSETPEEIGYATVFIGNEKAVFSGFVIKAHSIIPYFDNIFLGYMLRSSMLRKQIIQRGQGAVHVNISQENLHSVLVPCPHRTEQTAIAAALSDVDALLASLDALIAKKRDMKQAAMQELLTGRQRLPGFNGEWQTIRLGEYATFLRNKAFSRSQLSSSGEIHCLHYGDIHNSNETIINAEEMPYITATELKNLDFLTDGDLVFVDASEDLDGVGKSVEISHLSGKKLISGLHTIPVRFSKGIFSDGFKRYLQFIPSFILHVKRLASGLKVFSTQKSHIAEAAVTLPSPAEQTAIAAVLSDMDAEIAALEARRAKTQNLKQGMMQELLTGRTRLRPAEGESHA